jgi:hypothetical protein
VEVDLKTLCGEEAGFVVMLLGDFGGEWGKSCFRVTGLKQFTVTAPNRSIRVPFFGKKGSGQFDVNESTC